MVCSFFVTSFHHQGETYHCSLFVDSICDVHIFRLCSVSIFSLCSVFIFSLCSVSIFSLCSVSIFSLCYVRFLVCFLCGVWTRPTRAPRVWLASLASGRFAAAAAISRPQAISPNIIVFLVHG